MYYFIVFRKPVKNFLATEQIDQQQRLDDIQKPGWHSTTSALEVVEVSNPINRWFGVLFEKSRPTYVFIQKLPDLKKIMKTQSKNASIFFFLSDSSYGSKEL